MGSGSNMGALMIGFSLFFEFPWTGYFILKYQRTMVFDSHMGALVN